MPYTVADDGRDEFATPDGLELLDQLCLTLLECLLITDGVQDDVKLNLDELIGGLNAIQHAARSAFRAASLLNQGAEFESAWSENFSRPKAVFARHHAAIRAGASQVVPYEPAASLFDEVLDAAAPIDNAQEFGGARKACTSTTKTGRPCSNAGVYLGSGSFAQHCYTHLTVVERRRFDDHRREIAAHEERLMAERDERIARAVEQVRAEWQSRLRPDSGWLAVHVGAPRITGQ